MAVVRNDDTKLHQLVAKAIENATVITFDRVDIPPGKTVTVEDRFLANEGTQASIAAGLLCHVDRPEEPEAGSDADGDQTEPQAKKGRGGK